MLRLLLSFLFLFPCLLLAQEGTPPPGSDPRFYEIADGASPERLQSDIQQLVDFGTRHTLSDTVSQTRGIGAARRWIKSEFETISKDCGGCLEVNFQRNLVPAEGNSRIPEDTWVVNVVAVQRGTVYPNRYVIMSGDIDSRVSDPLDRTSDSPGANDNASGMAGTIEAARVLSKYEFSTSIIYVGLSGEEQGLFGGKGLAEKAKKEGWDIIGIINNDMIGNIHGIDGVIDNTTFRVFSEPNFIDDGERERIWRRFYGGEVDGPSRQLARYIDRLTDQYCTNLDAIMIYRLDRFGRGGHHRPFNDAGFSGVRIMETHENYNRQHQDLRTEDGVEYGDVIEGVDFNYCAKLTGVNAISLAGLASAPPPPANLMIGGAVKPSTRLRWDAPEGLEKLTKKGDKLAGYRVYWRDTTSPVWQYSRFVPAGTTDYTLEKIVVDNFFFGVASVSELGHESMVVFPTSLIPRGLNK
jgi:hypothetical protein